MNSTYLMPVDLEVVVVLVPQALVVVVDGAVATAVIRDEEVVGYVARDHVRGWAAVGTCESC